MSKDIAYTSSILETLGHNLKKDRNAQVYSQNAINTAETIVKECLEIFREMDEALLKKIKKLGLDGSSSRVAAVTLERLKWPFLRPKMMLLWSNLDRLKSSLDLLLNVFIYARLLVKRTEEPSIVDDQRSMIEHLLRTTAEQSRKYESLKAAMDGKEPPIGAGDATERYLPGVSGLDAATLPIGSPSKSRFRRLEASVVDPANEGLDGYCTLIEHLLTEVEAEEYNIGHEMRSRIRDDVIHTHKRETRLLRECHGDAKLEEKMREMSSRQFKMAQRETEEGEVSQMERMERLPFGATVAPSKDSGVQVPALQPILSSQESETQKQVLGHEGPPANARRTTMGRIRTSIINPAMEMFFNHGIRDSPWSPYSLRFALTPLTSYVQNCHVPQLPVLRTGTSMLVTEGSHFMESMASSQDLAALTDSTDTDMYESTRSEIGEIVFDSLSLRVAEGEIFGDQGYDGPIGKDDGRLDTANRDSSASLVIST